VSVLITLTDVEPAVRLGKLLEEKELQTEMVSPLDDFRAALKRSKPSVVVMTGGLLDPHNLQLVRELLWDEVAVVGFADVRDPAIDELFANSPDETFTQDEKSFMSQFITQQFDLPRNLSLLAVMTVLVAVLAATNTMSMNFRDRLSEYATLRAIGYSGQRILTLIQAESLIVCLVGGVLGALGPYIAFTATPLKDFTVPLIQHLEIRPLVCLYAVGIAALIGLLAAAWPSWLAARLKVLDAFRLLE
jgi:ABC-type antimicrobial peptide transport system permease subunit